MRGGDRITQSDAQRLLEWEVNSKARDVELAVGPGVSLYQSQFDALVSFTYNLGARNLKTPAFATFARWVYAGKTKLRGLIIRREAEADMYFSYY